ncbi:hypothetical protein ACFQ3N_14425 [Virgibacillus byunsanensis]|uniref:DUF945 domain-containing protein n=1 Tax=Virgibacillus byunsanensis TaxID=570945 RepID=A0ABW3LQG2_9BACI
MGSKKIIAIIIGTVLVVGGSVAAFVLLNLPAKQTYFLAEKNSAEFLVDKFEERYQPELDWMEVTQEKPFETALELSAHYNDPNSGMGMGMFSPEQIINNSTLTITSAMDRDNKQLNSEIKADIGGMEVGDITFDLTADKVMLGLPFLEETLLLKEEDIGNLLKEIEPNTFTGNENFDFNTFFESNNMLSEDDLEYLKEEYATLIYDELPDDAFTSTDETVNVSNETIDTEKIDFKLSEEEVKDLLTIVLNKMESDDRLKEILKEQIVVQQFGLGISASNLSPVMETEMDDFINEFESGLKEAQSALQDFHIPNGLRSTIWIKDDLIVKRDFSIEMGPSTEELGTFTVQGSQLFTDVSQTFDYVIGVTDAYMDESVTVAGDLAWKDNKVSDSINLTAGGTEIIYEGTESLDDGKRDFERIFSMNDNNGEIGSFHWSGNATYQNDQMNSEHNLSIESPEISQDMFGLTILTNAKAIQSVDISSEENSKDIGIMSMDELMQYMELEVTPQFQQWMFSTMGAGGSF